MEELDAIIAYEQGELDMDDTIALFQRLINSGLAWSLQGSYGRMAAGLIKSGHCQPRPKEGAPRELNFG
jgi:hypothetical protein